MFYKISLKKMRLLFMLVGFIAILFLGSCENFEMNSYFKKVAIPHQAWKGNEPLVFEINVEDVIAPYYYFLYLQHDDHYPYSNFWGEISVYRGNDSIPILTQRIEADLADNRGNWLGAGTQDIVQHKIPFSFKEPLEFGDAGIYRFELKQLMRIDPLPMISAGVLMEKGYKKNIDAEEVEDSIADELEGITKAF